MNATKTFFDIINLYSDKIVIGIIAPKIEVLAFKARLSLSEINHSINLKIDDSLLDKLSNSKYWSFNINKKDFKEFKTNDISLVKVFEQGDKHFAVIFNGLKPLTLEIKPYSYYDYNCNHEPDNEVYKIIRDMCNLTPFCSKDDYREAIQNVWCFKDGIHATNGSHAIIEYQDIPQKYQEISIDKRDLLAIHKIFKIDETATLSRVNYMNNKNQPDQITETKIKVSTKWKLNMEINYLPYLSRPALENLIREDQKNRQLKLSLKDLKTLKKELMFFKKNINVSDDYIRLDINPKKITISDKTLLLSRDIELDNNNNVSSCLLCFKVDYILNVIGYVIEKKYPLTYIKWKHSKKILDPVLVISYSSGKHCSTGVLMPVQIRDDNFYHLSYDDYKQYWKESTNQ
jgi:hypothetical protein